MNEYELIRFLQEEVIAVGDQKTYASKVGISEQYLSDILNNKRMPGKKVLKALGMVRVVEYYWEHSKE